MCIKKLSTRILRKIEIIKEEIRIIKIKDKEVRKIIIIYKSIMREARLRRIVLKRNLKKDFTLINRNSTF